ncbi:MAG: cytochrome c-type biogenesis protein CcmH [Alphaproteobacteria bacterium]|nr:cytochrome c-type biogenesis protein CcmH [Alphaproteobacteria bacterium]
MLDSRSAFSSASLVGNDDKDYWRSFREFLSASFLRKQESRAINNRIPAFAEMTALVIFLIFTTISPALAMTGPEEKLSDPALEKRARALYYEVRCPVCDSQSIAESNAGISTALRAHIRKSLLAGQSDEVIIAGLRQSYGNDITMTPPVNNATYALWYAPFILLIFGVIAAFVVIRTANRQQ